jgi:hypothetical protein
MKTYLCDECGEEITDTMLSDHTGRFWHEDCTPPCMPARQKAEGEHRENPPEWAESFQSLWENRLAILDDFRRRGVLFRIAEDTLQFRDCDGTLSEGERHYLTHCADGLKRALWKEEGLCVRCGQEGAYRDSTWCKPCVLEVGGQHRDRLLADLRLRKKKAAEAENDDEDDLMTTERSLELWEQ